MPTPTGLTQCHGWLRLRIEVAAAEARFAAADLDEAVAMTIETRRLGLARMPLASGPLTPNQIQTIVNWISRGAPND